MIFDTSNTVDKKKALAFLESLEGVIEIKVKGKSRSQNAYLWVCITLYGISVGLTKAEAEFDVKKYCLFMRYEKNGQMYPRSIAGLDKEEASTLIDWIRNRAGMNNYYIPSAEEWQENQYEIQKEINIHKQYL